MITRANRSSLFHPRRALFLLAALIFGGNAAASSLVDYALSDIRVLYLFDRADRIDWPVIYYLNDEFGARVDLVSMHHRPGFRYARQALEEKEIYWHQFQIDENVPYQVDSAFSRVLGERRPDVVIFGEASSLTTANILYAQAESFLSSLPPDTASIFNILRVFQRLEANESEAKNKVILSREELWQKYESRIRMELPRLSNRFSPNREMAERLALYTLVKKTSTLESLTPDFLSGLEQLRLEKLVASFGANGASSNVLTGHGRDFVSLFALSRRLTGQERAESLIKGYKKLLELNYELSRSETMGRSPELTAYIGRLLSRAQRAVLGEIGLEWQGKIIVRDSPHGPKLKFRASLSANGSNPVELSYVRFLPYWDESPTVLDSISRLIAPHQMYVREYGIDVDRRYLESEMPESLSFSAEIIYGRIPLTVTSALPIWEKPDLNISFEPGFTFVPPVARLDIDRVSQPLNWKVVITKPMYYHGNAKIELETPRGIFAGAYRQNIRLNKGRTTETIRIPFSVSNLFEPGTQKQVVSLLIGDRLIASDTAMIRIAESTVADTVSIGFMPDSLGQLEDILRMVAATHRPLTDRSLLTGDLDAYNVIAIGSGALRDYPSFRSVRGRLEEFVRQGGSLIVFGQPESWPVEALPLSLVPSMEKLTGERLLNRIPEARLLSRPYRISEKLLFSSLSSPQMLSAAVISPAEKVYVTPSGATLLSVTRIGSGQIIYCGLPLLEMISQLNIEAIHLLSNLLNY